MKCKRCGGSKDRDFRCGLCDRCAFPGRRKELTVGISKKAVLASIRSRKTPAGLKKGLRRYARRKGWVR